MSSFEQMNQILKQQKEFFIKNGAPSVDLRIDRLQRLKTLIMDNRYDFIDALNSDFGNRSKNALVAAGIIAILGELYGEQFQTLVLASQPERLGEWRRCLQDALGLNREDFGPNSGVVLFERAEPLIERADRLEAENEVPLILIDAAEKSIEIPILQFPIWLTFAATHNELYIEEELI